MQGIKTHMHGTGGGRHAIETHIFAHTDNLRHKATKTT